MYLVIQILYLSVDSIMQMVFLVDTVGSINTASIVTSGHCLHYKHSWSPLLTHEIKFNALSFP